MNSNSDFVIENGVLKEYHGPGGDVTIPEGVAEIGERAFEGCAALREVILPQTVRKIGPWAFYKCVHLTRIVCHEKSRSFRTEGPLVLSKRGAAVKCCAPGTAGVCEIPEGVHKIDAYAFRLLSANWSSAPGRRSFPGRRGLGRVYRPEGTDLARQRGVFGAKRVCGLRTSPLEHP